MRGPQRAVHEPRPARRHPRSTAPTSASPPTPPLAPPLACRLSIYSLVACALSHRQRGVAPGHLAPLLAVTAVAIIATLAVVGASNDHVLSATLPPGQPRTTVAAALEAPMLAASYWYSLAAATLYLRCVAAALLLRLYRWRHLMPKAQPQLKELPEELKGAPPPPTPSCHHAHGMCILLVVHVRVLRACACEVRACTCVMGV